jgi:D-glycero-alpha-D-manno-heptose 1-phosphate guanylyltransferase
MNDIPVLILAGGKGTRLQSMVSDVPKPMAPIEGKPFLNFVLSYLKGFGFRKMILLTGYKSEVIRDFFVDGKSMGLDVQYINEDQPLGTGGAVRQALLQGKDERYLILNGDTFYGIDYEKFISRCDSPVNIALHHVQQTGRYGTVVLDEDEKIKAFSEKNSSISEGLINAGVYLIDRQLVAYIPEGFSSLETDIFPKLIQEKLVKGVSMQGEFIDIGIPEDYLRAQKEIPKWVERGSYGQ